MINRACVRMYGRKKKLIEYKKAFCTHQGDWLKKIIVTKIILEVAWFVGKLSGLYSPPRKMR